MLFLNFLIRFKSNFIFVSLSMFLFYWIRDHPFVCSYLFFFFRFQINSVYLQWSHIRSLYVLRVNARISMMLSLMITISKPTMKHKEKIIIMKKLNVYFNWIKRSRVLFVIHINIMKLLIDHIERWNEIDIRLKVETWLHYWSSNSS